MLLFRSQTQLYSIISHLVLLEGPRAAGRHKNVTVEGGSVR